jgi:hypothetical protein
MKTSSPTPRPFRRLTLLDLENLAGLPLLDGKRTLRLHSQLEKVYSGSPRDITIVGGHKGNAIPCGLMARLNHGSICLRNGPNGADLALISKAREVPDGAFQSDISPIKEFVVGSGDGIFCEVASEMKSRGLSLTVITRRFSLSRCLGNMADRIIYIDQPPTEEKKAA